MTKHRLFLFVLYLHLTSIIVLGEEKRKKGILSTIAAISDTVGEYFDETAVGDVSNLITIGATFAQYSSQTVPIPTVTSISQRSSDGSFTLSFSPSACSAVGTYFDTWVPQISFDGRMVTWAISCNDVESHHTTLNCHASTDRAAIHFVTLDEACDNKWKNSEYTKGIRHYHVSIPSDLARLHTESASWRRFEKKIVFKWRSEGLTCSQMFYHKRAGAPRGSVIQRNDYYIVDPQFNRVEASCYDSNAYEVTCSNVPTNRGLLLYVGVQHKCVLKDEPEVSFTYGPNSLLPVWMSPTSAPTVHYAFLKDSKIVVNATSVYPNCFDVTGYQRAGWYVELFDGYSWSQVYCLVHSNNSELLFDCVANEIIPRLYQLQFKEVCAYLEVSSLTSSPITFEILSAQPLIYQHLNFSYVEDRRLLNISLNKPENTCKSIGSDHWYYLIEVQEDSRWTSLRCRLNDKNSSIEAACYRGWIPGVEHNIRITDICRLPGLSAPATLFSFTPPLPEAPTVTNFEWVAQGSSRGLLIANFSSALKDCKAIGSSFHCFQWQYRGPNDTDWKLGGCAKSATASLSLHFQPKGLYFLRVAELCTYVNVRSEYSLEVNSSIPQVLPPTNLTAQIIQNAVTVNWTSLSSCSAFGSRTLAHRWQYSTVPNVWRVADCEATASPTTCNIIWDGSPLSLRVAVLCSHHPISSEWSEQTNIVSWTKAIPPSSLSVVSTDYNTATIQWNFQPNASCSGIVSNSHTGYSFYFTPIIGNTEVIAKAFVGYCNIPTDGTAVCSRLNVNTLYKLQMRQDCEFVQSSSELSEAIQILTLNPYSVSGEVIKHSSLYAFSSDSASNTFGSQFRLNTYTESVVGFSGLYVPKNMTVKFASISIPTYIQMVPLPVSDGFTRDYPVCSVDIQGDTILVGTCNKQVGQNPGQGQVYVYTRERNSKDWLEQTRLIASNGSYGDFFGRDVAIDGNTAIIGACAQREDEKGSAYIFTRVGDNWEEVAILEHPDIDAEWFGMSVSISGNIAVVGAGGFNIKGSVSVYIYDGQQWRLRTVIADPDGYRGDGFGWSVALYNDTLVIGAPYKTWNGVFKSGLVFVYRQINDHWLLQETLSDSNAITNEQYGISVALDKDRIIVGASSKEVQGRIYQGQVFVYTRQADQIVKEAVLDDPSGSASSAFGYAVSIEGNVAVVGVPAWNAERGKIVTFRRIGSQWTADQVLTNSEAEQYWRFGVSVATGGNIVLTGEWPVGQYANQGRAYIHNVEETCGSLPDSTTLSEQFLIKGSLHIQKDIYQPFAPIKRPSLYPNQVSTSVPWGVNFLGKESSIDSPDLKDIITDLIALHRLTSSSDFMSFSFIIPASNHGNISSSITKNCNDIILTLIVSHDECIGDIGPACDAGYTCIDHDVETFGTAICCSGDQSCTAPSYQITSNASYACSDRLQWSNGVIQLTNIKIPRGAIILDAHLILVQEKLFIGEGYVDTQNFGMVSDGLGLCDVMSSANHTSIETGRLYLNQSIQTIRFSNILQEIVNANSWTSGDNLLFVMQATSQTNVIGVYFSNQVTFYPPYYTIKYAYDECLKDNGGCLPGFTCLDTIQTEDGGVKCELNECTLPDACPDRFYTCHDSNWTIISGVQCTLDECQAQLNPCPAEASCNDTNIFMVGGVICTWNECDCHDQCTVGTFCVDDNLHSGNNSRCECVNYNVSSIASGCFFDECTYNHGGCNLIETCKDLNFTTLSTVECTLDECTLSSTCPTDADCIDNDIYHLNTSVCTWNECLLNSTCPSGAVCRDDDLHAVGAVTCSLDECTIVGTCPGDSQCSDSDFTTIGGVLCLLDECTINNGNCFEFADCIDINLTAIGGVQCTLDECENNNGGCYGACLDTDINQLGGVQCAKNECLTGGDNGGCTGYCLDTDLWKSNTVNCSYDECGNSTCPIGLQCVDRDLWTLQTWECTSASFDECSQDNGGCRDLCMDEDNTTRNSVKCSYNECEDPISCMGYARCYDFDPFQNATLFCVSEDQIKYFFKKTSEECRLNSTGCLLSDRQFLTVNDTQYKGVSFLAKHTVDAPKTPNFGNKSVFFEVNAVGGDGAKISPFVFDSQYPMVLHYSVGLYRRPITLLYYETQKNEWIVANNTCDHNPSEVNGTITFKICHLTLFAISYGTMDGKSNTDNFAPSTIDEIVTGDEGQKDRKSSTALIVGILVGVFVFLVLLLAAVIVIIFKRRS